MPWHSLQPAVEANSTISPAMVERNILREKPHSAAGGGVPKGFAKHVSGARRWAHKSHREMYRSALSRSVRTQKAKNLSAQHRKRKVLESVYPLSSGPRTIFLRDSHKLQGQRHKTLILIKTWASIVKS